MDREKVLHDLRKIANAMKMISLQTAGDQKLKTKILLLSQHLDKLYEHIDIAPKPKEEQNGNSA